MGRKQRLDFTGIDSFIKCAEGEHVAVLESIKEDTTQAGDDCLKATFKVVQGKSKGAKILETFTLTEKALWKLQVYLRALGKKASGRMTLDLDVMEGKKCIIEVEHKDGQDKKGNAVLRANIVTFKSLATKDEDDEDTEEQKTPAPKKKPTPKKKPEPEVDEFDEDDEDEWEDE
jgi:hypothetical protein